MQILPKANTLRKSVLLYRGLRYRRGYGVHSPFVFNLITKVIEERCSYYSFNDIELIRKQFLFRDDVISCPDRRRKGQMRHYTTGQLVAREAIKPKQGALLFRLANYFQSKNILQLGTAAGLSTLYLTSYATGLRCIALENRPELASVARSVFEKGARNPVDLRTGDYRELLPGALEELEKVDFVFFNALSEQPDNVWLFNKCMKQAHDGSVFVFEGIKANRKMRELWKYIGGHPDVTVTVDLYSMGIVFFNKKLHKRNYIVYL